MTELDNFVINLIKDNNEELVVNNRFDRILDILESSKLEEQFGCTIFNKEYLVQELNEAIIKLKIEKISIIKQMITKNILIQIDFNTIFKSVLNFSLVFINHNNLYKPTVLYDNKKIDFNSVKDDLMKNETKLSIFPKFKELYMHTLLLCIQKFINGDQTVKFYCTNIPNTYWLLLTNYFKKNYNTQMISDITTKHVGIEAIINGIYYKEKYLEREMEENIISKIVLNKVFINKLFLNKLFPEEEYNTYKIEVLSYLNDNQVEYFLNNNEELTNINDINEYYKKLQTIISECSNIIMKLYYINKLLIITKSDLIKLNYKPKIDDIIVIIKEYSYILDDIGLSLCVCIKKTLEWFNES